LSRPVRAFSRGLAPATAQAGLKIQPLVAARVASRDKMSCTWTPRRRRGAPPFVPAGNTARDKRSFFVYFFFHLKRVFVYLYGSTFVYILFLYSFQKKFSYIYTLLRSCIYKITCLTIEHIQIYIISIFTWRSHSIYIYNSSSIRLHGRGSSVAPIHIKCSGVVYNLFQQKTRQFLCNS